jgi:hypothetical protein
MRRNNFKFIKFSIFLLIISIIFFGFCANLLANCQGTDPLSNCNDCGNDKSLCDSSPMHCAYDTAKTKCCGRLELAWPSSPAGSQISSCSDLTAFIKYFYEWGIVLGGFIAFVALVIAGFKYLTSVGDYVKMADARNQVIAAVAGLILLLASFLILNTLNPELTVLKIPNVEVPGGPGGGTPPNVPPDTIKNCNRVNIWTEGNNGQGEQCTTTGGAVIIDTIDINIPGTIGIPKDKHYYFQIASTTGDGTDKLKDKTSGVCTVSLHATACTDDPMAVFFMGCVPLKAYPLPNAIQCITVEPGPGSY